MHAPGQTHGHGGEISAQTTITLAGWPLSTQPQAFSPALFVGLVTGAPSLPSEHLAVGIRGLEVPSERWTDTHARAQRRASEPQRVRVQQLDDLSVHFNTRSPTHSLTQHTPIRCCAASGCATECSAHRRWALQCRTPSPAAWAGGAQRGGAAGLLFGGLGACLTALFRSGHFECAQLRGVRSPFCRSPQMGGGVCVPVHRGPKTFSGRRWRPKSCCSSWFTVGVRLGGPEGGVRPDT